LLVAGYAFLLNNIHREIRLKQAPHLGVKEAFNGLVREIDGEHILTTYTLRTVVTDEKTEEFETIIRTYKVFSKKEADEREAHDALKQAEMDSLLRRLRRMGV
jgi:hypothetical protein